MTIKLVRIAERDGLTFLCDKEGKELWQVVPKEPSDAILSGGVNRRWPQLISIERMCNDFAEVIHRLRTQELTNVGATLDRWQAIKKQK